MPTRAAAGLIVLTALAGSALARPAEAGLRRSEVRARAGRESLSIRVVDAARGTPLPARVVVRDAAGKAVKSEYEHLPGVFTADDGALELPLSPGRYTLEVHHGIDFVSQQHPFEVRPGAGTTARIALEPWWLCAISAGRTATGMRTCTRTRRATRR